MPLLHYAVLIQTDLLMNHLDSCLEELSLDIYLLATISKLVFIRFVELLVQGGRGYMGVDRT